VDRIELYIGGAWIAPRSAQTIAVENPATEAVLGHVPAGSPSDVDAAVAAARAAFPAWAALDQAKRGAHLDRLHAALSARKELVAQTVAREVGTPMKVAQRIQTDLPLTVLRGYADMPAADPETVGNSLVVREPVGVVGAITPWNYPLHQMMAKVAAALAAGCTVVAKPAELSPLVAFVFFDAVHEAGLPPGVVNLVSGTGAETGAALAAHSDVDMVSFTGSTAVGAEISRLAAGRIARVALELGGKSANVILDDADLVKAVKVGVGNAFLNAGQTCTAWTRMLVHRSRYAEALEIAAASAEGYTMGDPFDEATRLGPVISARQRERVRSFIAQGVDGGARVIAGGLSAKVPDTGYYVPGTVLADVDPASVVAQEEIFGPVLAVIPFDTDDEAVAIANNTRYGLAGGVWSSDVDRALAVARRMRTGAVDINGAAFNPLAPFGGFKQSGFGRELGLHGLSEFLEVKAIQR
jgi:aldehyde dehydrogenase (NAD+)